MNPDNQFRPQDGDPMASHYIAPADLKSPLITPAVIAPNNEALLSDKVDDRLNTDENERYMYDRWHWFKNPRHVVLLVLVLIFFSIAGIALGNLTAQK
jgi:hypothetical protein